MLYLTLHVHIFRIQFDLLMLLLKGYITALDTTFMFNWGRLTPVKLYPLKIHLWPSVAQHSADTPCPTAQTGSAHRETNKALHQIYTLNTDSFLRLALHSLCLEMKCVRMRCREPLCARSFSAPGQSGRSSAWYRAPGEGHHDMTEQSLTTRAHENSQFTMKWFSLPSMDSSLAGVA